MKTSIVLACLLLAPPSPQESPWPGPVKDWVAPQPGEHPRLFFRKADLPKLKERMKTPEGQAIVKRLRFLLDGADGEGMPTEFNPNKGKQADGSGKFSETAPVGKTYTLFHGAGYGFLWQLTGEKKYADLGRQAVEKALDGTRDRDNRYSFRDPGGALRCGPSLGAIAMAYDLCYDGWDAEFRKRVVDAFMSYDEGPHMSLESCALGKRQHPGSNHWGAQIGGPAMVLLAVKGDPGADEGKVNRLLAGSEKCFLRQLTEGWGDHGFFAEGDGPGAISSDTSFIPALQAWRIAGGKDFVAPRPNAAWMTLKWAMMSLPGPKAAFPLRGTYGHNVWSRAGMSGSGTFAQGFGAIPEEAKPALLWTYNHTFKAAEDKDGKPCDTVSPYPHRAVLAFINWPIGMQEKNPAEYFPKAVEDKHFGFYMFRNRWQDENDIVVTALYKGARGNYSVPGGDIMVWGLGQKTAFPVKVTGEVKSFAPLKQGGVVSTSAGSLGVDFSGASGAEALIVLAGPVQGDKSGGKAQTITAGKNTFTLMVLGKISSEPKAEGDKLIVGGQSVSYDGEKLVFEKQAGR
jgi:hypothetical protein